MLGTSMRRPPWCVDLDADDARSRSRLTRTRRPRREQGRIDDVQRAVVEAAAAERRVDRIIERVASGD